MLETNCLTEGDKERVLRRLQGSVVVGEVDGGLVMEVEGEVEREETEEQKEKREKKEKKEKKKAKKEKKEKKGEGEGEDEVVNTKKSEEEGVKSGKKETTKKGSSPPTAPATASSSSSAILEACKDIIGRCLDGDTGRLNMAHIFRASKGVVPVPADAGTVPESDGRLSSKDKFRATKMEICSGAGEWAIAQAKSDPGSNWITLELRHDRVYQTFARSVLSSVDNMCILCGDAMKILTQRIGT